LFSSFRFRLNAVLVGFWSPMRAARCSAGDAGSAVAADHLRRLLLVVVAGDFLQLGDFLGHRVQRPSWGRFSGISWGS
jgi:hypothetical protein